MSKRLNILDRFYQSRIATHAAFWILTLLLLTYSTSLFSGSFTDNLIYMSVLLPIQMTATYLMVYLQMQQLLYKRHWFLFFISVVPIVYSLAVLARLANIYIAEPLTGYEGVDESVWEVVSDPTYLIQAYILPVYIPAFLFLIFKMIKDRFQQENRLNELEKEKSNAELNFLKAQMNPHFLFNTLNNIYALAKNQSPDTPEMILKLSDLLDYTIYECNEPTVPIIKEWQLIENYVDLQAVRNSNQLMIAIHQNIEEEQTPIAPLILISIVENAFKHSTQRGQQLANIKISLEVVNKNLTFKVINTRSAVEAKKDTSKKKGIGVRNVKKQLALLYPNKHTYQVKELEETYMVILKIALGGIENK